MTRVSHHPAGPLSRGDMPTGFDVSLARYTDGFRTRIPDTFGPTQEMTGFDPAYANIVDYIVRITHRIWEDRDVGYIADCYADDSMVFDDYGLQRGNAKIIGDTRHTTGAFSDIVLDARDCIWAGDAQVGFRTSHCVDIRGTNDGASNYGPATGCVVDVPVIANCVSKANDIYLEHVLYNTSAMMLQLGLDPLAEAARLAADPLPGWPRSPETWAALKSAGAPARPLREAEPVGGFDPDAFTRDLHARLWSGDGPTDLERDHADGLTWQGASLRAGVGRDSYGDMVRQVRAELSDVRFSVDEVYWMGNGTDGWHVATRWSIDARHTGGALWGDATGAPLQIWGITQMQVRDGYVVEALLLFNELDVMIQAATARA